MKTLNKFALAGLGIASAFTTISCKKEVAKKLDEKKPNIVVIYVDDLGYGDVGYAGAKGVKTPNVDKLANNGLVFTDGHCSSATSTPSRYSLLTGEYAYRSKAHVLPGDAPLIIDTKKTTLPSMLQKAGYQTAVIGKWHLGLGAGNLDWNKKIKPGPAEIGFDYSFLIPATGDRVPCVFVENQEVVNGDPKDPIEVNYRKKVGNEPTGREFPELLKHPHSHGHDNTIINGVGRIGYMKGGNYARWKDEDFADILVQKSKNFINENQDKPFFLYLAYHDIHVPRVPHPRFVGKSTMGPRGDAIAQMDWCIGEIMNQLKKLGLDKNTIIIFSSDNGGVLDDGYKDQSAELVGDHKPNGPFRGGKYSAFEGGTRVPFITYWPGKIKPGKSEALVSQLDFVASFANLLGQQIPKGEAIDSKNTLDVFLGKTDKGREYLVEDAFVKTLRMGNFKYIPPRKGPKKIQWGVDMETGFNIKPQLYDLSNDAGERNNIAKQNPEIVKKMDDKLRKLTMDN
jgi:arylsulfatase A-like enzyme